MDNSNANNGGFSPNPNSFPGQFGSYDPNMGQQAQQMGQGMPMPQAPMAGYPQPQMQGMPMQGMPMQQNVPMQGMPMQGAPMQSDSMPPKSFGNQDELASNPVVVAPDANMPVPEPTPDATEPEVQKFKGFHTNNVVNVQTKSMIESPRDASDEELAKAKAYEDMLIRQQKQEKMKVKAERGGAYAALAIFGVLVLVVAGIFVFNIIRSANSGGAVVIPGEEEGKEQQYSVINGYQCKTDKCVHMDDLPDGRILLRDNDYYIYNKNDSTTTLTTIENREYQSIESFKWGDKILAVVDPETDKSALYDVIENRMITDYLYDSFMTDVEDKNVYGEMTNLISEYIIAHNSGPEQYTVIRLSDGEAVLRGKKYVFIHDGFYFGYEDDGEVRVYTSGAASAFKVVGNGGALYTRDGTLIVANEKGTGVTYYSREGTTITASKLSFYSDIRGQSAKNLIALYANTPSTYYKIPMTPPSN